MAFSFEFLFLFLLLGLFLLFSASIPIYRLGIVVLEFTDQLTFSFRVERNMVGNEIEFGKAFIKFATEDCLLLKHKQDILKFRRGRIHYLRGEITISNNRILVKVRYPYWVIILVLGILIFLAYALIGVNPLSYNFVVVIVMMSSVCLIALFSFLSEKYDFMLAYDDAKHYMEKCSSVNIRDVNNDDNDIYPENE